MSEGITIAFISFAGVVLGAAIAGFASIAAAEVKKKGQNPISCGLVGLLASIGAGVGFVLGGLFSLMLLILAHVSKDSNRHCEQKPGSIPVSVAYAASSL